MRLALLFLIIVPTTAPSPAFVHTREQIGDRGWVDSVSISPQTYIDVRYDHSADGISVTLLGCRVNGTACDSPAQFRRLVSLSTENR